MNSQRNHVIEIAVIVPFTVEVEVGDDQDPDDVLERFDASSLGFLDAMGGISVRSGVTLVWEPNENAMWERAEIHKRDDDNA